MIKADPKSELYYLRLHWKYVVQKHTLASGSFESEAFVSFDGHTFCTLEYSFIGSFGGDWHPCEWHGERDGWENTSSPGGVSIETLILFFLFDLG